MLDRGGLITRSARGCSVYVCVWRESGEVVTLLRHTLLRTRPDCAQITSLDLPKRDFGCDSVTEDRSRQRLVVVVAVVKLGAIVSSLWVIAFFFLHNPH